MSFHALAIDGPFDGQTIENKYDCFSAYYNTDHSISILQEEEVEFPDFVVLSYRFFTYKGCNFWINKHFDGDILPYILNKLMTSYKPGRVEND